jgi:hypothetical protein
MLIGSGFNSGQETFDLIKHKPSCTALGFLSVCYYT